MIIRRELEPLLANVVEAGDHIFTAGCIADDESLDVGGQTRQALVPRFRSSPALAAGDERTSESKRDTRIIALLVRFRSRNSLETLPRAEANFSIIALADLDRWLAMCGSDRSHILRVVIWLSDIRFRDEMNAVWLAWVDPANLPARACIEARMATPGCLVEIMAAAVKPGADAKDRASR
jgi:enamine deaminase RidA (YjgF/YER057c/UK114 family)